MDRWRQISLFHSPRYRYAKARVVYSLRVQIEVYRFAYCLFHSFHRLDDATVTENKNNKVAIRTQFFSR